MEKIFLSPLSSSSLPLSSSSWPREVWPCCRRSRPSSTSSWPPCPVFYHICPSHAFSLPGFEEVDENCRWCSGPTSRPVHRSPWWQSPYQWATRFDVASFWEAPSTARHLAWTRRWWGRALCRPWASLCWCLSSVFLIIISIWPENFKVDQKWNGYLTLKLPGSDWRFLAQNL